MTSHFSPVWAQLDTYLQSQGLTLVPGGISVLGDNPMPDAGQALFDGGYFVRPAVMRRGRRMERLSRERVMGVQIYIGRAFEYAYQDTVDWLIEKSETILQGLLNCNENIPTAEIVEPSGDVQFVESFSETSITWAILPIKITYHME